MEDRYKISYEIRKVRYATPFYVQDKKRKNMPLIKIGLWGLKIGKAEENIMKIGARTGYNLIFIHMNKNTANANGINWDGTKEGVKKVRKNLTGKVFDLDLGIKDNFN